MSKEQLASCLLSIEVLVGGTELRTDQLSESEWMCPIEAGDILSHAQLYFNDSSGIAMLKMETKVRRLKNVDMITIDCLQLVFSSRRTDNYVQEILEVTRSLKIMAKELHVPALVLSQLMHASEKRTEHRPVFSNLHDSGPIEQDADVVLFSYREDYYRGPGTPDEDTDHNSGECIIAKNRHGEPKTIPLHWQGGFM